MGAEIAKANPPKEVAAAAVCVNNANKVVDSPTVLIRLQAAWDKTLGVRDRLLPDRTRAYAKLKKLPTASALGHTCGSTNLTVTRPASSTCRAATTMPMPPSPILSSTR